MGYQIFTDAAIAEAVKPQDDEDIRFEVVTDPNGSGRAVIKAYDAETGEFIGNL